MQLAVVDLEECSRVQVRAGKPDADVVTRYAEFMKSGAIFPPVVVFREKGTERYVVADGHHRLRAAQQIGAKKIDVDLREGDENDAIEFALGANSDHGLPRTGKDIRRAVDLLMSNDYLKRKYKTHVDRADLLKISERTFQTRLAEWRESDGGNKKAKAEAKENAAKHTAPKAAKQDSPSVVTPLGNGSTSHERESSDPQWTSDDEASYSDLMDAWEAATPAARKQFKREHC